MPETETETAVAKVDIRSLAKVDRYVSLVALNIPEGLSYEQWADLGKGLSLSRRMVHNGSLMWWVGDWLAYGEQNIGEAYAQAVESTGYNKQTLYNAKHVSKNVPPSRRRDSLSWSHHKAVASLSEADQEYLLQLAATDHLSYPQVKKMADAIHNGIADAETNGLAASDEVENLPSPEETARVTEQAMEALKKDTMTLNDMIDDYSSISFAFWEVINAGSKVDSSELAKMQALAKAVSEITGRIASTIYALL